MGQRVFGQLGVALHQLHHHVVLGRAPLGHDVGGEVGQGDHHGLQFVRRGLLLGRETHRALLEVGHEAFALLGLVAAALAHEHADLLGGLVLLGQAGVQFGLEGLAAVVELLDACEGGCGVDAFFCEFPDRKLPVVAQLL